MKLRHIFTMLMTAVALTFVGCQEPERFLDEVKVSQSYIAIPAAGGDVTITVDAVAEWSVVAIDKKTFKEIAMPEWLTISPLSGPKGKTEVTFSAGETKETREVFLNLNCKDVCQELNVMQMTQKPEAALSTCNEVLTNGVVDQFYRIKGVVAEIPLADFQKYGKFFITDDSTDKSVQIYGCANKALYLDKSNNPTIEVGDIVTIEGSWSKYGNFNNDTQILEVEKSLIKVEKLSPSSALDADGDVFTATLTNKGEGLEISIPEADQVWLSAGEPFVAGTTTVVEFTALANAAAPRTTTITFSTTSGGQTYSASATIEQNGGIPQVTVKEAIALPADSWIRVTGIVTGIHKKGVVVTDEAGDAIYAYVNKTEAELGAALGDKVNVTGKIGSYANFYQIVSPEIEVVSSGNKPVYPATVTLDTAESFKAYEKGTYSSIYIEATGVTTGQYGDITIGDWVVSPYQTSETINIADFKDKEVTVKGYLLQYKSPNTLRVMLTSVKEAVEEVPTIADVIKAGVQDEAVTEGVIVAKYTRGALISDGTGYMLIYKSAEVTEAVGDKVQVSGPTSMFGGMLQFTKDCTIKKISSGNPVNHPAVTVLDGAGMDEQLTKTSVSYIEYTGTLSVNGYYYNVAIDGASKAQGSLQYIDAAAFPAAVNGAKIKVRGYFIGVSGGKYVNTMTVDVQGL